MKLIFLITLALAVFKTTNAWSLTDQDQTIEFYQNRYPLKDVYSKLVDNEGNGFEALYGVRNFRAVLNGVVYRGGANNVYNKHGKRSNMNPLPNEGLEHLCSEGFSSAVYLYSTNFSTAPKVTRCQSMFSSANDVEYRTENVLSNDVDSRAVLKLVYDRLTSQTDHGPIYLHCWNGWHASGFISSLILRQYCGFTGEEAVNYWNKNTDGNNGSSFEPIRKKIRAFQSYAEFAIDSTLRAKICPSAH